MPDFILTEGDKANFLPTFGMAVVVVKPGSLQGSGLATINGKKMCVKGDETAVEVSDCPYISVQYPISGMGTLKIAKLAADQIAKKTKTGGDLVLLRGGQFTAVFQVSTPAKHPSGLQDIAKKEYSGKGTFMNTNKKIKGS
jgi:hypothetical protein